MPGMFGLSFPGSSPDIEGLDAVLHDVHTGFLALVCRMICQSLLEALFEYDTVKIVHIKSKKVGLINRFIQLVIICYIIG